MAKKTAKKTTQARTPRKRGLETPIENERTLSSSRKTSRTASAGEYKDVLREFISNPAVKYVAGGIATAILARIATNISDRYPEISNFIKENLDTVEGKLNEFRNDYGASSARH